MLGRWRPAAVAIEALYSHYAHPMTAVLMGHARGALCLAAAQHDVPVFSYTATAVKRGLTGNGRASKQQIQRTLERMLSLEEKLEPEDVADALALALHHAEVTSAGRERLKASLA
jgi:crossover junction endodeoxyribonuclease RuvC